MAFSVYKDRRFAVLGLIVLCVIFLISTILVGARRQAEQVKSANLEQEISALRGENEKLSQLNETLQESLNDLRGKLEEEKNLAQSLKGALAQEQLVSQSLRSELEKVMKEKEGLQKSRSRRRR